MTRRHLRERVLHHFLRSSGGFFGVFVCSVGMVSSVIGAMLAVYASSLGIISLLVMTWALLVW